MTKTYIVSSLLKRLAETTVLTFLMYSYVILRLGDNPVRLSETTRGHLCALHLWSYIYRYIAKYFFDDYPGFHLKGGARP